jgi:hypothetical protein
MVNNDASSQSAQRRANALDRCDAALCKVVAPSSPHDIADDQQRQRAEDAGANAVESISEPLLQRNILGPRTVAVVAVEHLIVVALGHCQAQRLDYLALSPRQTQSVTQRIRLSPAG